MAAYGRNRQSLADIEENLYQVLEQHPSSTPTEDGTPTIPANALIDVLSTLSEMYGGIELMKAHEIEQLQALLAANPGLAVTPAVLFQFIAERTKVSPEHSPEDSPREDDFDLPERGRHDDREEGYHSNSYSRSSSNESNGTTVFRRVGSRPPSRGPPATPKGPSPFDVKNRQRTTPLNSAAPPTSWSKPTPASRRKSIDSGSRSDSESSLGPTPYTGRTPGRHRAPSNPTSPRSAGFDREPYTPSPPHSRSASRQGFHTKSPSLDESSFNESFMQKINSLPMPRPDDDNDSDDDNSLGLIMDRSVASSTASLEPLERLDALTKANAELQRRLLETDRTYQNALQQNEADMYELNMKLEEARQELNLSKKEEKELRTKERSNTNQIAALESDVAKLTKSLDHARSNYASLQRKYSEQCAASENYRDELRQREETIRSLRENITLQEVEATKWTKETAQFEERIAGLERELEVAAQTQAELDEQKQENLMLKETIDRMRFDMDEMRNSAAAAASGTVSGPNSAANTVSKSLGAELLKIKDSLEKEQQDDEEASEDTEVETELSDDTESEDVVQTIITRKTRKVASRAARIERHEYEETKEYSDASIQYEAVEFLRNVSCQTLPPPKRLSTTSQTVPPVSSHASMQTETEPLPVMVEVDIQTDYVEIHVSRPSSPEAETMASSSSTVLPPTPKPKEEELHQHLDDPPAYNQEQEDRDRGIAIETLKKWHKGLTEIPSTGVPNGIRIPEDSVAEWEALKKELGIDCSVIDNIIAESSKLPRDPAAKRKSRFYNIYNTYVYGKKDGSGTPSLLHSALVAAGASAITILFVSHVVQSNSVPGGPTYWDRPAWNSFNSMQNSGEGFTPDGTTAVWNFLGRVGGGAARMARGWPT